MKIKSDGTILFSNQETLDFYYDYLHFFHVFFDNREELFYNTGPYRGRSNIFDLKFNEYLTHLHQKGYVNSSDINSINMMYKKINFVEIDDALLFHNRIPKLISCINKAKIRFLYNFEGSTINRIQIYNHPCDTSFEVAIYYTDSKGNQLSTRLYQTMSFESDPITGLLRYKSDKEKKEQILLHTVLNDFYECLNVIYNQIEILFNEGI